MGSQTLEILRQGVWASLTGGWFYDPHQGVFCNVVHLYLWLYLLCSPFVAYLYFPGTWITWLIYCILTSLTILVVKIVNMALHRLYDQAQSMSEANLKNPFFKVTKETPSSENESGIELKVMNNDGSRNSVEQTINEASEENSMMSMENVNSIIDLKVDVHRKNSSESIEMMFYAPSMTSGNSQREDQQSLAGSASVTKSIRSTSNSGIPAPSSVIQQYSIVPEVESESHRNNRHSNAASSNDTPRIKRQPRLLRKSSEDYRRRTHRLNANDSSMPSKLIRQHTVDGSSSSGATTATRNETFLHSKSNAHATTTTTSNVLSLSSNNHASTVTTSNCQSVAHDHQAQRLNTTIPTTAGSIVTESNVAGSTNAASSKITRLQRHRSSETHDERLKQQNRSLFLPIHSAEQHHHHHPHHHGHGHAHHHHHNHIASAASSSGALAAIGGGILDADEMELGMGGSTSGVGGTNRALLSWILGSSSDVYLEDDSYTKSDFGIEQLDARIAATAGRTAFLLKQQQQHLNAHYQHQQQHRIQQPHFHHHHHQHQASGSSSSAGVAGIRKDSNSTMSALQLPVLPINKSSLNACSNSSHGNAGGSSTSGYGAGTKRRRHSNATAFFKSSTSSAAGLASTAASHHHPNTVRRIKSTALEIACPQPSVSNLSPHPNSVEAISGQQQIKNPQSALLPPPSKCLKRNAHLNLCPKLGQDSSSNGSSINFDGAASACGSTTALIETSSYQQQQQAAKETQQSRSKEDALESLVLEDISIDNEDLLLDAAASIKCALMTVESHCDMDDDDEVDEVVPVRRRLKALDCRQHQRMNRHSAESDVGEILAADEDDAFKDFDDNLEHILNDLNQTQNQLHDYLQEINITAGTMVPESNGDEASGSAAVGGASSMQQVEGVLQTTVHDNAETTESIEHENAREAFHHSTDSENENNNGSRSPLLSAKNYDNAASAAAEDKSLRFEVLEARRQRSSPTPLATTSASALPRNRVAALNQRIVKGSEIDSGCPSSDCEQISASSKDMLLAGMDLNDELPKDVDIENANEQPSCSSRTLSSVAASTTTTTASATTIKNLGAIPKLVKYREIDETRRSRSDAAHSSSATQLHKRRGSGRHAYEPSQHSSQNAVAPSRATSSSSNSLSSINTDSFSTDLHKILWLMHGVTVDERGRTVPTLAGSDSSGQKPLVMPPKMTAARLQLYQDALQAFQAAESSGLHEQQGLTVYERNYLWDKLREAKLAYGELASGSSPAIDELQLSQTASSNTQLVNSNAGIVRASNSGLSSALNSRNVTTITLEEALYHINEEHKTLNTAQTTRNSSVTHASNAAVSSHSNPAAGAGPAVLNFDNLRCENYCEYWGPPIILVDKTVAPKSFYKYRFKFFGYDHEIKISMDRLELLALFDHDLHWIHILLSVFLCSLVAFLGATILQHGYYKDLFAFLFCAVIAGAQYSLVKSVQPDAASPIHGFNKTVAYSRAIYFSLCAGLLLWLKQTVDDYKLLPVEHLQFFGVRYAPAELAAVMLQLMYILLLCFPLIFSLGLFPQVNTFLMYFLEQVDMHVFGGNAAGSLLGSFLCVCRSLMGVLLLYGPLFAALSEQRGTQYILFSIFCAMLIPLGYHLSRSASDFSHLWALIKHCIVSTYRDDDDDLSADSSNGGLRHAKTSTPKSSKNRKNSDKLKQQSASNEHIEMSPIEAANEAQSQPANDEQNQFERKSSKSKASSLGSSSQTLAKTLSSSKKAITASSSYASVNGAEGGVVLTQDLNAAEERTTIETASLNGELVEPQAQEDDDNNNKNKEPLATANNGENVVVVVEQQQQPAHNTKPTAGTNDACEKVSNSSRATTTHAVDMSTLTGGLLNIDGSTTLCDDANTQNPQQDNNNSSTDSESPDPLPRKLQNTVNTRLKNDFVVSIFLAVVVLGLHCSTVFSVLQPELNVVLYAFTAALGLVLHYIIPQLRKHMPWLCFARPLLRQFEYGQYEVSNAPKVMWFEKAYIYFCILERNILFPLLVISALTADASAIAMKFGAAWGSVIVAVCALKFIRNAYSDPTNQYLIVLFTVLLFRADFRMASETFLIDYFFVSIAFRKCCDFLLKLQFIVTYIAPWQITWGSAFHAFAQPFSVPHSAMLFLQAGVSAALSTPLNPFLGSAIFLTSYVRPIKFWERDYNTRRIDHSNTRLSSQLERDLGADDNNLNSIFYEHLTRSLQHSLCGDLLMGRWGNVNQGDCFVLASDYLNCLVHIIELGNGLCTFQMRGLEFRGTYCQQREVEAITEDVEDNDGCCCCDPGHLPRMLSANAMFSTRWLAWQVVAAQYVLEGYSITDNLASATLQVFEYRKVLITYYIKSIIYYVVKNPKLEQWLTSPALQESLQHTLSRHFVDLDPIFNYNLDEDFDFRAVGITRSSFCYVYLSWINYCYDKRKEPPQPKATPTQQQSTPTPSHITQQPTFSANTTTTLTPPTTATTTTITTTTNVANDTRSSPNLATQITQNKSQSQQQLRTSTRPQKSATMSGSTTVSQNHASSEQIASSQSFASISRQTSESAPGLTAYAVSYSLESAAPNIGRTASIKTTATSTAPTKPLRKDESPRNANSTAKPNAKASTNNPSDKVYLKLKVPSIAKDSPLVSLCLALGLLARRSLATASHSSLTGVEYFLHGLHALFKGDFRIQSPRDEWVFADMELLHGVVAPAVKMALKLQQDHISNPDEYLDPSALYEAIDTCSKDLVISHEADPVWRSAVLRGAPNLLALRHVMEDGSDEYRIIRLTKRFLSFRVIKLNRECVRGLWAGQQQELIYLRNRNPERGSIQNAKQALRNIINSSCDQPIGYPIYVSPLTTSYADTNDQLRRVAGGPITPESIKANVLDWWQRIRERCRQGCSSGSATENSQMGFVGSMPAGMGGVGLTGINAGAALAGSNTCSIVAGDTNEVNPVYISAPIYNTLTVNNFFGLRSGNVPANLSTAAGALSTPYAGDSLAVMRSGLAMMPVKPTSTTLIAGLLSREREQDAVAAAVTARELRVGSAGARKSQTGQAASSSGSGGGGGGGGSTAAISQTPRSERERRATLPIAGPSLGAASGNGRANGSQQQVSSSTPNQNAESSPQFEECDKYNDDTMSYATGSPRYANISCSSGNLGINNIITTPGDYPRKTKGPICLTAASASNAKLMGERSLKSFAAATSAAASGSSVAAGDSCRKPRIELFKKVIIVDDTEIYDYLDMGLLTDFVWPSEKMRANGGLFSWNGWEPIVGLVGYVVHCWIPNHADVRKRSPFNRIVYLVEIGKHYVPVGEYGLREYNHLVHSPDDLALQNSRRSSLENEYDEFRMQQQHFQQHQQRSEGLTPILGSSLESPTSQLSAAVTAAAAAKAASESAASCEAVDEAAAANAEECSASGSNAAESLTVAATAPSSSANKPKIQAVSSSSSEDEHGSYIFEMQRREFLLNMWKLIAEKKKQTVEAIESLDDEHNETDGADVRLAEQAAISTTESTHAEAIEHAATNEERMSEDEDVKRIDDAGGVDDRDADDDENIEFKDFEYYGDSLDDLLENDTKLAVDDDKLHSLNDEETCRETNPNETMNNITTMTEVSNSAEIADVTTITTAYDDERSFEISEQAEIEDDEGNDDEKKNANDVVEVCYDDDVDDGVDDAEAAELAEILHAIECAEFDEAALNDAEESDVNIDADLPATSSAAELIVRANDDDDVAAVQSTTTTTTTSNTATTTTTTAATTTAATSLGTESSDLPANLTEAETTVSEIQGGGNIEINNETTTSLDESSEV